MISFNERMEADHANMLNSDEFGVSCINARTAATFNIIKTDSFVEITESGTAIIEDKPMFNTLQTNDIKAFDVLTIGGIAYIVRDVKRDGIGGIDVYLKG